ncbi:copper homeostasis protein CutC [Tabrizicola sp.]|uniref:copper homeostasis protein CutC n=1 Tax=Tabrizicola sp. TaxID=2005166 RepID=UPI002629C5EB|nr:copper homeostasis protein CutC [Tabrizicola sp.]MDM7931875.1 copper homeostasis protein CutC [Tabrizicola sp.]
MGIDAARVTIEVCVDCSAGLAAAISGGADRIELCSALALGGLTPSPGLMAEAAGCGVPVLAMIRPRAGGFVWSEAEVRGMLADITAARATGLAGVVLGASLPDGQLDQAVLRRLVTAAAGLDLTLHRCFDLTPDMGAALEVAVSLGFRRILTSGGEATAAAGASRIAALVAQAQGRISVMPGAGVSPANAAMLMALGVSELHGSCSVAVQTQGRAVDLGFGPAEQRRTDADRVRALRHALE